MHGCIVCFSAYIDWFVIFFSVFSLWLGFMRIEFSVVIWGSFWFTTGRFLWLIRVQLLLWCRLFLLMGPFAWFDVTPIRSGFQFAGFWFPIWLNFVHFF
jgi:hypothetical protein